jgi:hypothetical protein
MTPSENYKGANGKVILFVGPKKVESDEDTSINPITAWLEAYESVNDIDESCEDTESTESSEDTE